MVKNAGGGNKSKKQARKNVAPGMGGGANTLGVRRVVDPAEMYAAVTKIYSSKRCDVIGTDGLTRACNVRGKFLKKRRGGGDILAVGAWIMIGFYDWEVRSDGARSCDLLEIYNSIERDKLKQIETPQALGAIINIGDGASGDCTFSNFTQGPAKANDEDDDDDDSSGDNNNKEEDGAVGGWGSSSEDDDEKKVDAAVQATINKDKKIKQEAAAAAGSYLRDVLAVKNKEPIQNQMDWLTVNERDI
jgi:hypothetical protein